MYMQMAQIGFAALGGISSYKAQKAQAKAQAALQEYRNKMTNIANAISQNAITQNTTLQIQQSARQAVHLRRDAVKTEGSVEAAAAAAGVKGRSVNATLLDVQRNASLVDKQRADDLENFFLQQQQQRLNATMSAVQNQDLSIIAKPSFATEMIGAMSGVSSATYQGVADSLRSQKGDQQIQFSDYFSSGARSDISASSRGMFGPYRF